MQAANSTAAEASGRRLTRSLQHVPNLASPSSSSSYSTSSSLSPISSRSFSPSEQPRTALSGRACELSTVSEVAALPHVDSARLRSSVMRPAISTGESTAESQQVCSASISNNQSAALRHSCYAKTQLVYFGFVLQSSSHWN
jgi:hypothetical protein